MKKKRIAITLLSLIVSVALSFAQDSYEGQRFAIAGEVTDKESGESLIGATVFVAGTSKGVITNAYGFYSLVLPADDYSIIVSYIGYESQVFKLSLTKDLDLNVALLTASTSIEEVVVSAERKDHNVSSTDIGIEKLSMAKLAKVPVLMGEKDILKTIQLMPGISTVSEGSSGYSVRGGSTDQNLILLDEAPVYNASHLMGFFSVFNADALKGGTVYKGGIPANFGGRASSVLDIQMKDGNKNQFHASGGIGLISSRLTVESPLFNDQSSFIVSGRRSYADIVAKASGIIDEKVTLYFYDLNAKMNMRIGEHDRLFISGYFGRDDFGYESFGTDWGNATGTLRWNHLFGKRLFLNSTLIYSDFDYGFMMEDAIHMSSGIEDFAVKEDFTYFLRPEHTLKFGLSSTLHKFNPGAIESLESDTIFNINYVMPKKKALESGVYLSANSKFNSRLSAEYGLRVSSFAQLGEGTSYTYDEQNERSDSVVYASNEVMADYLHFEPRVSMNYRLNEQSSVKASYNRIAQYLHQLSASTSGQPMDTWVPSSVNIEPVIANQVSVGYFRNFLDNNIEFSIETYYKALDHVLDYENGADLMFNEDVEAVVIPGEGRSYGMEFYLKKNYGAFTGWISYTLSRTENLIEEITDSWYPSSYDKTHDVSIVGSYEFNKRMNLSATWIYYTGNAVTFPSGKYNIGYVPVPYYTERNGYRMPHYHRLDLNFHIEGKNEKRFQSSWDFSVYNAYHRYNAYIISFRESETIVGATEAVKLSLFGIVPSVTWNFKF